MSQILAGGEVFQAQKYLDDPLPAQPCLVRARRAHGHALCQCVTPNRRLVIRSVNGVLFLTVWPNDGPMHDPGCEFFRELPFDAGDSSDHAGGVSGQARRRRSAAFINGDGVWDVNLDMQTSKGITTYESSLTPSVEPCDDRVATPVRDSLNMQQFLTWLWDSTSMVRWGSGWKRDWWRVTRAIRTEAQAVSIHGRNFNRQLYIPPSFRSNMEMQINDEWNAFTAPLFKSSALGTPERAFLLVEVKSIDRTEYGFKLQAKHMARPIFMDENIYAQIAKRSSLPLLLLPQSKKRRCSIVALLLVEGTGRGNLRVVDVSLMLVNQYFIPVGTTYELELSNTLCEADRTFTRGASRLTGADFVLRDTFPPTAMMIYSLNSPDYVRNRNAVVEQCVRDGCSIWKWDLASNFTCPTLPATSSRSSSVRTTKAIG